VNSGRGYRLAPHDLAAQVTALVALGDQADGIRTAAGQLGERPPLLGTAPPALHLAMRLRQATGGAGLAGQINAASTELTQFHRSLRRAVTNYLDGEASIARLFGVGGPTGGQA
jgi:hypothetical protein